jgi:hypothetical protein
MSDWQQVFAPMEQALEKMLAQTEAPADAAEAEPPLAGAVPILDDVLAPVARTLARAEEHVRAADLHAEDALTALVPWRDRVAALRERLATTLLRAV